MPFIELDTHKILKRMDEIMAAIDDLNTAVAILQTTVTSAITALGTPGTNNDAQVEVDVATITAANAALQAALGAGAVVTTPVVTASVASSPTQTAVPGRADQVVGI
jgi:hypothetical protein